MTELYFLVFWIPATASAVMLVIGWRAGMLERPTRFFVWFFAALVFQFKAGLFSPAWAIGLMGQVTLGLYLAIRFKLE